MEYTLQLNDFLLQGKAMVLRVKPFVDALAAQPTRADILPKTLDLCYQLFRYIQGNARLLGLDRLGEPADVMEYLLDRVRSGVLSLTPAQITLLAEAVSFFDCGLAQVLVDKDDAGLAESAAALVEALRGAVQDLPGMGEGHQDQPGLEPSMQETLLRESEGILEVAEGECVLWDFIAVDAERVAGLVRMLSQLKRNFALLAFSALERLGAALELTLQRFLGGDFFQTEYPERVFIRCIDAMRSSLAGHTPGLAPEVPGLDDHLAALQGLIRQPIGTLLVEAGLVDAKTVDTALQMQKGDVGSAPRRLGEVLVEMGEVTPEEVERILATQQQKRVRAARAESALDELSVRDRLLLPESARESVRVDSSQLVRMIALIEQLAGEGSTPLLTELRSLARSCRRDILRAFSARLHRLVHDMATKQDKKVFFSLDGIEETLEPGDMELLFAPLLGLLRNAIEHGLEDASARLESGKDRSGRLSLMALRQGDQVWISVEDDGRGLNRQAILDAAVARGVVSRGEAEELTKRDIVRMLLQQRGAVDGGETERRESGLAAVNRIVQRMNGSIDMFSRPGKGTRITLKLPNAR